MNKKFVTALALAATLALTGCGGVKKDATYDNATDLRAAVLKSGVECPGEVVEDNGHEGSIKCTSELILEIINDESFLSIAHVALQFTGGGDVLTGPNWLIQGDAETLAKIQKKLGGELRVV